MRFSLRQIEVFLATAQQQNISKAAEHLSLSQSAASSALRELEQQFGLQLFDRVGKRLRLNENGMALRPKAQNLISAAEQLENSFKDHAGLGNLRVGATLTIGNYLAVPLVAKYMHDAQALGQEAKVDLHVANTDSIARQVLNYELDIGLIEGEFNHPQLRNQHWRDDELLIVANPKHSLANSSALNDEQLLSLRWISREHGSGTRQAFEHALHGLVPQLNIAMELEHTEAIKRAIEANLGVACLSRLAVEEALQRGSLIQLHAPHRDWRRRFYFVFHQDKAISHSLEHWLQLCQASDIHQ